MSTTWFAVGLAAFSTVVGAYGSLYFKWASAGSLSPRDVLKNKKLIAGVFLFGCSSLLYITALRQGELSVLYPIAALSYVWVMLLSQKYLNERMNRWKWAGVFFIIAGVMLVGMGS